MQLGTGQSKKLSEAARLWVRGELAVGGQREQDEALAAFGLVLEEAPEDREFHLWTENVPVWNLWQAVQTQWRIGMNGPTGLDYAGIEALMRMRNVSRAERPELIEGLQVMEVVALEEFAAKAEKDQRRKAR
ncbi:MAG: DUF1799 domain-containing protein [Burkholderiales bacterium]